MATTVSLQRAASALGLAPEAGVCRLTPEQEIGPYYIAGELLRSDIVEGKPGVPLSLRLVLLDARTCQPLSNAAVDLWHCDALGLYSGFTKQNPMGPGGPPPPGFGPHRASIRNIQEIILDRPRGEWDFPRKTTPRIISRFFAAYR